MRIQRPAWPWRLLAWVQLVLCGLISLFALLVAPLSSLVLVVATWVMLGGLFAYGYGRPARPIWFWRIFAVLLGLYLMWDLGADIARFLGDFPGGPQARGSRAVLFLISLPLNIFSCIALLRHSQLLRGKQRSALRDLEGVFA